MTTTSDADADDVVDGSTPIDTGPTRTRAGALRRHAGPVAVAVTGTFATLTVALAMLQPDPAARADEVRSGAATIVSAVTGGSDLAEFSTDALERQLVDGRVDTGALNELSGWTADEPVVLHVDDREARVVVVLRDGERRRLELILLHDGDWRLDRYEVY